MRLAALICLLGLMRLPVRGFLVRRSILPIGLAFALLASVSSTPAFASSARPSDPESVRVASTTNYGYQMFFGSSGPFGGHTTIIIHVHVYYDGTTSSITAQPTGTWDGHKISSSQIAAYGSTPTHWWANVYEGTDWRGVAKWFYPRIDIGASGRPVFKDGGGSYWPLIGED